MRLRRRTPRFWLALLALVAAPSTGIAQCLDWSSGFETPGPAEGVAALTAIDLGPLRGVYAGGEFRAAGNVAANNIARWDGVAWQALGAGVTGGRNPRISALCVLNGNVFAAGSFTTAGGTPASNIARWNGTTWSPLGSGTDGAVLALAAYDDGSGPALYAGGMFTEAGEVSAQYLARWNGTTWSPVPGAPVGPVTSFAVSPPTFPGGRALFVGGEFTGTMAVSAANVARFDGLTWSALAGGTDELVQALAFHDDGAGLKMYAGGSFASADSTAAPRVASWNGNTWDDVGAGPANADKFDNVRALFSFGGSLYAGGRFRTLHGAPADFVARWNGGSWATVAAGANGSVRAFTAWNSNIPSDGPCATALYASGHFTRASSGVASRVARLCSNTWTPLGTGAGASASIEVLHSSPIGLVAGGSFTAAGSTNAERIAVWNGVGWSPLGNGLDGAVHALATFDDGSGPALYAGGAFKKSGAQNLNFIAKWNGSAWVPLSQGMLGPVFALAVFDDGSGPKLYSGGAFAGTSATLALEFTPVPQVHAPNVSRWNGTAWTPVAFGFNGTVRALAVHAGLLYAGGEFTTAGSVQANHIARLQSGAWRRLAHGVDGPVLALASFGGNLVVGGRFSAAGLVPARNIALWNESNWSALGAGTNDAVSALCVFDDHAGGGPALYAAGDFQNAGATPAARIARWNGVVWSALGSGLNEGALALCVHDDGSGGGEDLFVGGEFTVSGGRVASRIAKWLGCP
ncbi:MAG: hypothetical protein ACKVWV_15310 [Planctomycetota bacterium]